MTEKGGGGNREERQGVQSREEQGGSLNAEGRKEHVANENEKQVTQAVQGAVENTVGKAVLAKDG